MGVIMLTPEPIITNEILCASCNQPIPYTLESKQAGFMTIQVPSVGVCKCRRALTHNQVSEILEDLQESVNDLNHHIKVANQINATKSVGYGVDVGERDALVEVIRLINQKLQESKNAN